VNLEDRVALVTGARRGIGQGIALALAQAGAKVVVTDVDQTDCQKVVDQIRESGQTGLALKVDVSKKSEVEEAVQKTIKEFNKIDILVNNAGIAQFKPFLELTEEEWDRTLDINLKGMFLCCQAVAREMAKNKYGRIINIASIASGQVGVGFLNIAHYCASKGGVTALTEALALELAPLGINVNAIGPGVIETPMTKDLLSDPKSKEGLMARIPKKRLGQPKDIASAAVFLASAEADYVTGVTLFVDGGWLAG
jgi:NAD(P)-dependent dehydrogenase (short-subunit alcohol dehydrogenase family)